VQGYVRKHLRLYLVDDHDIVRQGLSDLLVGHRDFYIVGDSGSARRAIEEIPRLKPDVVVLDLQLQDGSGISVCRAIRAADPSIQVLLLTSAGDDDALAAAVLAGAAGYVIKLVRTQVIVEAVRRVGTGQILMEAAAVDRIGRQLRTKLQATTEPTTDDDVVLLSQVLEGLTDQEIADRNKQPLETVTLSTSALIDRLTGAWLRM
jgi:two-component system, NarL family, response regulator DevR